MKKFFTFLFSLFFLFCSLTPSNAKENQILYSQTEIVVQLFSKNDFSKLKSDFPESEHIFSNYYSRKDYVQYAEFNYLINVPDIEKQDITKQNTSPNDTYFYKQWGLKTIQAPEAWDFTTGSKDVYVAITMEKEVQFLTVYMEHM